MTPPAGLLAFWGPRAALGAAAVVAAALSARTWNEAPKSREVHYRLGSHAATVVEIDARWSDEATGEPVREATFRYAPGGAPRVVVHEPVLADGRYAVALNVVSVAARGPGNAAGDRRTTEVVAHVQVGSKEPPSIDLGPAIARTEENAAEGGGP